MADDALRQAASLGEQAARRAAAGHHTDARGLYMQACEILGVYHKQIDPSNEVRRQQVKGLMETFIVRLETMDAASRAEPEPEQPGPGFLQRLFSTRDPPAIPPRVIEPRPGVAVVAIAQQPKAMRRDYPKAPAQTTGVRAAHGTAPARSGTAGGMPKGSGVVRLSRAAPAVGAGTRAGPSKEQLEFRARIATEIVHNGPPVLFADIAGLEEAKRTLMEAVVTPQLRFEPLQLGSNLGSNLAALRARLREAVRHTDCAHTLCMQAGSVYRT
jgi:hypothetical protein